MLELQENRERADQGLSGTGWNGPQGHLQTDLPHQPCFASLGQTSFHPFVAVVFKLVDDAHYHVQRTLSPYGYSTYRGS
ncbi:MAG: hydroxyisourate hydrolase [Flavobacteriales bacterium]